jgi:asparagine synthase (glutamine-hydrolysing)
LPPATLLTLTAEDLARPGSVGNPETYWDLRDVVLAGRDHPWQGSDDEAVDELERVLRQAVAAQLMADVPLGAFLSGGIDSSTVVALMQAQSSRPVRTFSIGFHEEGYDEARYAKAVARHLGTEHTELYVTPAEAMAVIPRLPQIYDEPFADSSQIPTFLVAQLARQHVTVSLSGDAGDELFSGYTRYFIGAALSSRIKRIPRFVRQLGAAGIELFSPSVWSRVLGMMQPVLPQALRTPLAGEKLHKGARVIGAADGGALYRQLVTHWEPACVVLGAREPPTELDRTWSGVGSLTEQMMAWDSVSYLPDDILVKVDRAAMAVSLETRVPLLDHRVAEFAWRLPLRMKVGGGKGKLALRQVLHRYVPSALIERPKMGFGVPIDEWLRGPLREWAEDLLSEQALNARGFFDPAPIRRLWRDHLSGARNGQYPLWDVLMFESWLAEQQR